MRRQINKKGQSSLEYASLIVVVVAALLVTSVFLVRALQGKYRQSADVFGGGEQYDKIDTVIPDADYTGQDVDQPGVTGPDACSGISTRVTNLEDNVVMLRDKADKMDARVADLEATANNPIVGGTSTEQLRRTAAELRSQAQEYRVDADGDEAEANGLRANFPECF